ncbi:single-stranded DNA-binding protein [Nocardia fluminea]|uniref:Single-stranded DNA-binding protein n=1 Tax=Nocardia fluminea TaxID=134984 RepID=A0A2N3VHH3_9NOCA|nr:single-stranded DNA-binding protein [Nocardia fluminea]PKV81070.1 single-strand binding protein [Nocardia fluminea]
MPGEPTLPLVGNLSSDIELTFTPAGVAVAHFTVASTPRYFDRNTNQWRDGEALFLRCNLWRDAAENAAESLVKGARVLVMGRLKQRSYETRDGDKRTVYELEVDELGPSLRFARAQVTRTAGQTGSGPRGSGFSQRDTTTPTTRANTAAVSQVADQWASDATDRGDERGSWETPVLAGAGAGFGEPPF